MALQENFYLDCYFNSMPSVRKRAIDPGEAEQAWRAEWRYRAKPDENIGTTATQGSRVLQLHTNPNSPFYCVGTGLRINIFDLSSSSIDHYKVVIVRRDDPDAPVPVSKFWIVTDTANPSKCYQVEQCGGAAKIDVTDITRKDFPSFPLAPYAFAQPDSTQPFYYNDYVVIEFDRPEVGTSNIVRLQITVEVTLSAPNGTKTRFSHDPEIDIDMGP